MSLSASPRGLEEQFDRLEAALQSLDEAMTRFEAGLARFSVELDLLTERVARLPSNGFWLAAMATEVVMVSGEIMFSETLKALIGL